MAKETHQLVYIHIGILTLHGNFYIFNIKKIRGNIEGVTLEDSFFMMIKYFDEHIDRVILKCEVNEHPSFMDDCLEVYDLLEKMTKEGFLKKQKNDTYVFDCGAISYLELNGV